MNIFRRSFSTINKFSTLSTKGRFLPNIDNLKQRCEFSSGPSNDESKGRLRLNLRRQNLPPYPHIDLVRDLKVENYLPSSFKNVKYGEFEFSERFDGYVCMYIGAYMNTRDLDAKPGYSVYFGSDHPLNLQGGVEHRQTLNHAHLYGFLKGMEQIPKDSFKKLCIMTSHISMTTFIGRALPQMSENSFRSIQSGRLNKDLQTSMEINRVLRSRDDLIFQVMWCPSDMGVDGMHHAKKMAEEAAKTVTLDAKKQAFT
ncbi:uncharacterized protein LOC116343864 isoform X1 [Contarinia nasturtii]|uniref:uncharacterized protein LOC116343864 isoform X1 n=1 Tax=Contarinia nasturtii TaxID=265458 RepID=UPI0012D3BCAA|nr:uncharacterized protein LOC116343864 isoform X1 [Contarinia nasturtii]